MTGDLAKHEGKTVLVTGGASGIGLGIVNRMLSEGANVLSLDLKPAPLATSERFISLVGNAASEDDVNKAVKKAQIEFGRLDVMVCNAGVISINAVVDTDFDEWKRVTEINLPRVFLGSRAAARAMIDQGFGGVIINAASGAARRGVPNLSAYCASKAAIIMLTQSLAVELAPHKIRCNCYAPGHIETPFWGDIASGFAKVTGKSPKQVIEGFKESVPWGRFGTPDDVAGTVSFLASDDAQYISGQAIAMNGAEFPY